MILKRILAGYAALIKSFLVFLVLMAICVGAGFLVVFPLWKLASADPGLYTILFGLILGLVIAVIAGRSMYRAFRQNKRLFFISCGRKLTILVGICLPVYLVLSWHRLMAGLVLLAAVAVYGYLAFATGPAKK